MTPDELKTRIQSSFARQGMMASFQASLTAIAPGTVEITAPIRPETGQQQGFAHAALTFGLGDSAAGYSALSLLEPSFEVVTSEMKINLLAPAVGDALIARGRVIKPGRRLLVVQADVFASDQGKEKHVALLTGTMVPVLV
ncbi:PaaI family thioesterase [Thalassococcus lentus]|uniref:PaaI family thioesterase n=1 Tax=Thalassococcus lentus TaxID=1210524 RepID=A0ABT4XQ67_9RHOB|nr:PaaI family thioesterase [Thalassococcus lentus]MDA7424099.1 PaaI family thioesterase [Thalassococcus lentus]